MKRRLQVIIVAVIVTIGLIPTAPAQAASGCGLHTYCQYNWYTESEWTHLVGQRITNCDGSSTFWGTVTGFRQTISEPC